LLRLLQQLCLKLRLLLRHSLKQQKACLWRVRKRWECLPVRERQLLVKTLKRAYSKVPPLIQKIMTNRQRMEFLKNKEARISD
jgi:hypothetical protein